MEKTINIGGKEVRMRVSARIPFEYRQFFGKDIIAEMQKLSGKNGFESFEVFEQLAWIMAGKPGYPIKTAPEAIAEWLDYFDGMFDIVNALPEIAALWAEGNATQSTARKK